MTPLENTPAWQAVAGHARRLGELPLPALFAVDPRRVERFTFEAAGLQVDLSKQRIDAPALDALQRAAADRELPSWIARLFAGEPVNLTEQRAALHMALRAPRERSFRAVGMSVSDEVHAVLDRVCAFAEQVRDGQWRGASGETITDVVNIGIGGSDLGPRMVCAALGGREVPGPRTHFVANVDPAQCRDVLAGLDPARTLFVVTSKTFTTQETMANAQAARAWSGAALGADSVSRHFVAVSTNLDAVRAFGIGSGQCFAFWDWVGGRYSVWSAVGLAAVLRLGATRFRALLRGAWRMDEHFERAAPEHNLPVLMALLAVWNDLAMNCATQVVAPYAQRLCHFVGWLQQLEMESNGKGVMRDGTPLARSTPAVWGDVGTNGQHAFFQMLHQGPAVHPVDFILPIETPHPQQRMLIANALAQAAALMQGKSAEEVRFELAGRGMSGAALDAAIPHRVFPGNRPSTLIVMPRLDAEHLGALMALYEHRCFALSVLWGVNAFDQWGVELGKQLTHRLLDAGAPQDARVDASTRSHLHRLHPT